MPRRPPKNEPNLAAKANTDAVAPFTRPFDLSGLSERGQQIALNVTVGECAALARWAGIESVDNFRADVSLSRRGASQFRYDATFEANVTQSCVVTLEPVPAKVSGAFQRDYVLADHRPRGRRGPATAENFAPADSADDVPETLDQPVLDLAAPLIEEFMLGLDPYPRAPDANFAAGDTATPQSTDAAADNPFAVLAKLNKPK